MAFCRYWSCMIGIVPSSILLFRLLPDIIPILCSCNSPSTCKRSGQLSCSARRRVACGAANARRLDQHDYRGLGPRCSELRGRCCGRAAEDGQVDQGARARRPLSSFPDSFSPLIIRSSFLTSPSAAQKEALNGCTVGGGDSRISAPGAKIEGSILGKLGTADSKIVCFAACGASFASNSGGQ